MAESRPPDSLGETVPVDATPGALATPEFIASLLVDGDDDLAAWAIGQALEEHSRSSVFDDVVRRAMELVGTRWETGQWSISQEHLASVALAAALARLRPADADETRIGPVAVLAAPEGEQHVAGLICLAQILSRSTAGGREPWRERPGRRPAAVRVGSDGRPRGPLHRDPDIPARSAPDDRDAAQP